MHIYKICRQHQETIHQVCAVIATELFNGRCNRLGKMPFPTKCIWLCPLNIGCHWILVIVMKSQQCIILLDPQGQEHMYSSLLDNWRIFLRWYKMEQEGIEWKLVTMPHNIQQDSCSCGVLVLMFAKQFLANGNLTLVETSEAAIRKGRLQIACALLQE